MGNPVAHAPARLGRYELLARLATGGMGEIFLARLEGAAGFEKLYVVKRILPHLADDARFRQMLVAEARVTSKMAHANICQVYELGETDGQLYIVMEYLEGITLLPLLRKASKEQKPLEFGFIGGIIQQTCDALHYAHELRERSGEGLGVVHRDVTPSNVFLTDSGVAKILDFGIAKVKDASANTQTGTVKGKYAYMAPEQLRGGAIDRRVDLFALGIVLYEMLALRRLFQRPTDYLTFRAVMEQPMPDIRRYRADIPDAIAEVLGRALDREPDRRFATARQFGTAMLDALGARRPWSQGELADFVSANFAEEIARRHAQVAFAVQRTEIGALPPQALLTNDDTAVASYDDDEEFPSVEETMDEMPVMLRVEHRAHTEQPTQPGDFVGHTPQPFGLETSTNSGMSLQPLAPPVVVPPSRSMLWPLVAISMVLIAGGALFLVWRQQQQQQQPAPAPIVIQQYSDPADPAAPATPDETGSTPVLPGSGSNPVGSAGSAVKPPIKRPGGSNVATSVATDAAQRTAYERAMNAAIERVKPKLVDCVAHHGVPPVGTVMSLTISVEGRATSVTFKPASLDKGFATCVEQAVRASAYPKPSATFFQEVTLRAH